MHYFLGPGACGNLSPYECVEVLGTWYRIYERTSSWFMARQLCEAEGGQLALLKNKDLMEKVAAAIKKHHKDTKKYFIGFRSMDFTSASKWIIYPKVV